MFRKLLRTSVTFIKKEDGPTAVEYAVMLALIIVVCIAAITTLGSNADNTFSSVSVTATPAGAPELMSRSGIRQNSVFRKSEVGEFHCGYNVVS